MGELVHLTIGVLVIGSEREKSKGDAHVLECLVILVAAFDSFL